VNSEAAVRTGIRIRAVSRWQVYGASAQAFSHLALISAAVNRDHQRDHGVGGMPAVSGG
jgi:hypothetical protein